MSIAAAVLRRGGGVKGSAHVVAAGSDEFCGVLGSVLSVANARTVTSADGTTIDYDAYGSGPAVILIGGAGQYRAIDPPTAEIANHLARTASRQSPMTGAAVAA